MRFVKDKISAIFFLIISLLFAVKGLELYSLGKDVDGQGIGVYFFFIEINDRVPEESIPSYALGFFISSFVTVIIAFGLYLSKYISSNKVNVK